MYSPKRFIEKDWNAKAKALYSSGIILGKKKKMQSHHIK